MCALLPAWMQAMRPPSRACVAAAPRRTWRSPWKCNERALSSERGPTGEDMTYCVALRLDRGLVFAADTRTSAGNDNVAHYRKLHYWRRAGDRALTTPTAGNPAITQSVISILNEQLDELSGASESLFTVPSLYRAARLVGSALREVRQLDGHSLEAAAAGFNASFLLGGQIGSESPRLFQVYP